jgi:WD40 repeat protein
MKNPVFLSRENSVLRVTVLLSLLVAIVFGSLYFYSGYTAPEGKIVYRRTSSDATSLYEILVIDVKGNKSTSLGYFSGSPTWSRDGKYLALGCMHDLAQICIIDVTSIPDSEEFPIQGHVEIERSVTLPTPCRAVLSEKGLESISWSFDGRKLAVVCSENPNSEKREVCIIPIEEEEKASCWDHSWEYSINRVDWSPIDDVLVVSSSKKYGAKIYLVDINGKNETYLADGWGATWSPDGKQVAFMQWQNQFYSWEDGKLKIDESINQYTGLAVINKDGNGLKWLYRNPDNESDLTAIISFGCDGMSNVCRASWSPDGRYIIFSAASGGMYDYRIFRLDLRTGKIIFLSQLDQYSRFVSDPNWGP